MVTMSDQILWIDPIVTFNKKLTNEEAPHALTQSINSNGNYKLIIVASSMEGLWFSTL